MPRPASRAAHCALALAILALGACADETTAPTLPTADADAALVDPFTVTNTSDTGIGSLRWLLDHADSGQVIRFDPALAGQTIAIDSVLWISETVTIEGPDGGITIDGQNKTRMFYVGGPRTLTLRNMTITGGNSGLSVAGVVSGFNTKGVVLENSTIHGNRSAGGTAIEADRVVLVNSTVSGNLSNDAPTFTYPALLGDTLLLINSTVAHNTFAGVGTLIAKGQVTLRNSIVAHHGRENCTGLQSAIVREGENVSDDDSCGGPGEILIGDPKLGPLADNGGPSRTHAILAGSPAINTGMGCTVPVDQRYMPRDGQCDLGAFEFADFTTATVTVDAGVAVKQGSGWAVVTGTVTCSRAETFDVAVELRQQQKIGKRVGIVEATAVVPVACSTTPTPWTASLVTASGGFQVGSGTAVVHSEGTEPWVTPAAVTAPVKLYWSRK